MSTLLRWLTPWAQQRYWREVSWRWGEAMEFPTITLSDEQFVLWLTRGEILQVESTKQRFEWFAKRDATIMLVP